MIAISGASGALGRRVAELVLEQADPETVLLLTRTPDALRDLARRGARVERASFKNPTGLRQVLAGTQRLLMISTDGVGDRLDHHRQAISAARSAGVWHVVYTSCPQPGSANPAIVAAEHAQTEQALRDSGMDWTFLRNNLYADGLPEAAAQAAEAGVWLTNAADGAIAYVSREDCARAAAATLLTDGHERESYDITGPAALSIHELAALAGQAYGVDVAVDELDDAEYAVALESMGLPSTVAALVTSFGQAAREGFLSKVSTDVVALTGQAPVAVADLLRP